MERTLIDAYGFVNPGDPTHVFLSLKSPLEAVALHEFSHVVQLVDARFCQSDARLWLWEAQASYNVLVYGAKLYAKHLRFPPNLRSSDHYTSVYGKIVEGFMLWLDKSFPGFVDKSYQMTQKNCISWKDLEELTGGQSLERLWQKYKKINFATEMSPFLEEQWRKYLESDQPDSYGPDRDLTENTEEESDTEDTEGAERAERTKDTGNINIAIMIIFAYLVYKIVKRQERSNIGGWAQERQEWQGHYPQYPPHFGHIGGWAQERQGWQGHYPQYPPHFGHIGRRAQERQRWQGSYPQYPPHHGHIGRRAQERQEWQGHYPQYPPHHGHIGGWAGWQGHYPQYPPHHDHIGRRAQERQEWQGHYPQYPPHHGHIGRRAQERQRWQEPDDAEAMRMWNQFEEWIAY